jgi:hypothetical protein
VSHDKTKSRPGHVGLHGAAIPVQLARLDYVRAELAVGKLIIATPTASREPHMTIRPCGTPFRRNCWGLCLAHYAHNLSVWFLLRHNPTLLQSGKRAKFFRGFREEISEVRRLLVKTRGEGKALGGRPLRVGHSAIQQTPSVVSITWMSPGESQSCSEFHSP